MSKFNILAVILAAFIFISPVHARPPEGVDLAVVQGWDIVVDEGATPSEKYAAEELQEFFGQASGVKLPIVHKIDRPNRHIFIGPSEMLQASNVGFDVDDFGEEDLRIVIRDGNIAIAGGRPRGTLYGVYTFLEDYLGVRFLTGDHVYVPEVGDWRVVGPVDHFYHPPLEFRWSLLSRHCPVGKYGQEHPEYFALVGGQLMDEFLDLHYGRAATPIRRFIELVHNNAEARGVHRNCFGLAKDYAVDESIAQAGLEAFDEAMKLAESDVIRSRVEKASICAYRAAIEPIWYTKDPGKVEPALAQRMRPLDLLDIDSA